MNPFTPRFVQQSRVSASRHAIDFRNTRWDVPVNFEKTKFVNSYPAFSGASFNEGASFTADDFYWPQRNDSGHRASDIAESKRTDIRSESRSTMATLRHLMTSQGRPEDAHFFFRREMTFAGESDPWRGGLLYRLFGAVSDYGHSIVRPLVGLLWVFIAPLGVYFAAFGEATWWVFSKATAFSISSMFKIFGFQRIYFGFEFMQEAHVVVKLLAASQTVLAFILLFFLGLGLRTRFRLR